MQQAASRDASVAIMNGREKSGNCRIGAVINRFQRLEGILLWFLPVLVCACFKQKVKRLHLITVILQEPATV